MPRNNGVYKYHLRKDYTQRFIKIMLISKKKNIYTTNASSSPQCLSQSPI